MSETREQISGLRDAVADIPLSPVLTRLQEVTESLIGCHRRLAILLSVERQGKTRAYEESQETSHSARERYAEFMAVDTTAEIFRVKGEISALSEERNFLHYLLER